MLWTDFKLIVKTEIVTTMQLHKIIKTKYAWDESLNQTHNYFVTWLWFSVWNSFQENISQNILKQHSPGWCDFALHIKSLFFWQAYWFVLHLFFLFFHILHFFLWSFYKPKKIQTRDDHKKYVPNPQTWTKQLKWKARSYLRSFCHYKSKTLFTDVK